MEAASTQARGYGGRVGKHLQCQECASSRGLRGGWPSGGFLRLCIPVPGSRRHALPVFLPRCPKMQWSLLRLSLLGVVETLVSASAKPAAGVAAVCSSTPEPSWEIPDFPLCQGSSQLYQHLGAAGRPFVFRCESPWALVTSVGFFIFPFLFFFFFKS